MPIRRSIRRGLWASSCFLSGFLTPSLMLERTFVADPASIEPSPFLYFSHVMISQHLHDHVLRPCTLSVSASLFRFTLLTPARTKIRWTTPVIQARSMTDDFQFGHCRFAAFGTYSYTLPFLTIVFCDHVRVKAAPFCCHEEHVLYLV